MPSGVRCADTTRTSNGTSNSASVAAASDITVKSESLPMITPTTGSSSAMRVHLRSIAQCQVVRRRPGPLPDRRQVVAQRGHVADLATGPESLAVQVDLDIRPARHQVVHPLVQ